MKPRTVEAREAQQRGEFKFVSERPCCRCDGVLFYTKHHKDSSPRCVSCSNDRTSEYAINNRDKINKCNKKWSDNNKDYAKSKNRAYYEENREDLLLKQKAYYQNHKEELKAKRDAKK